LRTETSGRQHAVRSSLILAFAALIWGMSFVAQRIGMEFIGPFLFTGIRMLFGALTLLFVLLISDRVRAARHGGAGSPDMRPPDAGPKRPNRGPYPFLLKAGIACGLAIFLAGCFQQVGLVFTTASKSGFLTALYIVLVPILGIALRHKTHWNTWVSVLVAVVGLYFLCMTDGLFLQFGDAITLVGAFFWACHILIIDHFVEGLSSRGIMKLCIAQFAVASLLSFIAAPFFDGMLVAEVFDIQKLVDALPALLYAGVLSTGVAFTFQAVGQQGLSPSAASIIMSLEAVFSVVGGMLILGETLSGREIFGCVAMFAAVTLSQLPTPRPTHP
jgi:drug/metabolite transporter (DMT)-like permease